MFVVMDAGYGDPNAGLGEMIIDDLLGDDMDEGGGSIDPSQVTIC